VRIAVLSYLATYGNASGLAASLAEDLGCEVGLICRTDNAADGGDYGFLSELPASVPAWRLDRDGDLAGARAFAAAADRVVVMAMPSLAWIAPRVLDSPAAKRGAMVLSSSHLFAGLPWESRLIADMDTSAVEWNNRRIEAAGLAVFVQPHKRCYLVGPAAAAARPWFPPVAEIVPAQPAQGPVLIAHSPGKGGRLHWKGTPTVIRVFGRLEKELGDSVRCVVLKKMPHAEIMAARAGFHVFVDQLCGPVTVAGGFAPYRGGLDKSGLEAMAAGCAVVTSGGPFTFGGQTPEPPISWAGDEASLADVLRFLLCDADARADLAAAGRRWVRQWCRPAAVAGRILEAIQ